MTKLHVHGIHDDFTTPSGDGTGYGVDNAPSGYDAMVGAAAYASTSTALPTAVYLTEPGDSAAISVNDIHQGSLGDCFLLSSLGELALFHPSSITSMIYDNGDGTQTVGLYEASNGSLPTFGTSSYKPVQELVSDTFDARAANNSSTQDVVDGQKETWVQVEEKAFAQLSGGYNVIANGGNPALAMEALTGNSASALYSSSVSLPMLQSFVSAGDLLVFDTSSSSGLGYGLVSSHAYMFAGLTKSDGIDMVNLLNPWGTYEPSAIPFSSLKNAGIVEIDVGHA